MATQEKAVKAVQLAVKHLGQGDMVESARLCLVDAITNLSDRNWDGAWRRSVDSIAYSVGMFHRDYQEQKQELYRGQSG